MRKYTSLKKMSAVLIATSALNLCLNVDAFAANGVTQHNNVVINQDNWGLGRGLINDDTITINHHNANLSFVYNTLRLGTLNVNGKNSATLLLNGMMDLTQGDIVDLTNRNKKIKVVFGYSAEYEGVSNQININGNNINGLGDIQFGVDRESQNGTLIFSKLNGQNNNIIYNGNIYSLKATNPKGTIRINRNITFTKKIGYDSNNNIAPIRMIQILEGRLTVKDSVFLSIADSNTDISDGATLIVDSTVNEIEYASVFNSISMAGNEGKIIAKGVHPISFPRDIGVVDEVNVANRTTVREVFLEGTAPVTFSGNVSVNDFRIAQNDAIFNQNSYFDTVSFTDRGRAIITNGVKIAGHIKTKNHGQGGVVFEGSSDNVPKIGEANRKVEFVRAGSMNINFNNPTFANRFEVVEGGRVTINNANSNITEVVLNDQNSHITINQHSATPMSIIPAHDNFGVADLANITLGNVGGNNGEAIRLLNLLDNVNFTGHVRAHQWQFNPAGNYNVQAGAILYMPQGQEVNAPANLLANIQVLDAFVPAAPAAQIGAPVPGAAPAGEGIDAFDILNAADGAFAEQAPAVPDQQQAPVPGAAPAEEGIDAFDILNAADGAFAEQAPPVPAPVPAPATKSPVINENIKNFAKANGEMASSIVAYINEAATTAINSRFGDFNDSMKLGQDARLGSNGSGMAAGEGFSQAVNIWVKGFAGHGKQKSSKDSIGFKTTNSGGIIGIDTMLNESNLAGIAISHINLETKLTGLNVKNKTSANVLTAYLSSYLTEEIFLNSQVKYGKVNLKNSGDSKMKSKGTLAGIREELGYEMKLENDIRVTPTLGFSYDEEKFGKFREKGFREDVEVSGKKNKRLNALFGVNLAKSIDMDGYSLVPNIHAGIEQTLNSNNKAVKVTALDSTAESVLIPQKKVDRTTYIIGGGLKLISAGKMEIGVNYDLVKRKNFHSHNGSVKLRINF
jgi:hypothetical protein